MFLILLFESPLSLSQRNKSGLSTETQREMELSQHDFLDELLAPRRDSWSIYSSGVLNDGFLPNGWSFDSFEENPVLSNSNPSFSCFSTQKDPTFECPFNDQAYPFVDGSELTVPAEIDTSSLIPSQEDYPTVFDEEQEFGNFLGSENQSSLEDSKTCCKVEMDNQQPTTPGFNIGLYSGVPKKINKSKKIEGQPSKNLMAERRRRKRLNDRLSMLRSIVPKISKMDRTSILGDTIDYMKELVERINKLQEEGAEEGINEINLLGISKELKPNEVLVRNSPKFDVERRDQDTKIDICCASKPGLLLSMVNTLEALGLEIQQCVISCFTDFSMQASCSEGVEQRTLISCEDIRQALFRTAGYGGRCL